MPKSNKITNLVLLDDDYVIRFVVKKVLHSIYSPDQLNIYTAENGVDGLGYIFITKPEIIIIDTTLPKYSGREVLDYISTNQTLNKASRGLVLVLHSGVPSSDLPDHYVQLDKQHPKFLDKLVSAITQQNVAEPVANQFLRRGGWGSYVQFFASKALKFANNSDQASAKANKLKWFLNQTLTSIFLACFYLLTSNKDNDTNIAQKNIDSRNARTKVYPALAVLFATILICFLQLILVGGSFLGIFTITNKVLAASYTWDGGGLTNNWSDCDNWSTDVCPTSADTVTFNATSTKDSVMDASGAGTVLTYTIESTYSGTITVQRGVLVHTNFIQSGGTFNTGAQTLDINGTFTLNAGAIFTASSGTTSVAGAFTINGGTFNHNSGTLTIDGSTVATINCNNVTFNLVTLASTGGIKTIASNCNLPLGNNPVIPSSSVNISVQGTLSGTGTLSGAGGFAGFITMSTGSSLSGFTGLNKIHGFTVAGATLDLSSYTLPFYTENLSVSSGSLILPAGANFGPATVSGTGTLTAGSSIDFNSNLTLSGGTFNAPSGTMTLAVNLTVSGSAVFNHNNGTVTFDSAGGATLSCNNVTFNLVTFAHTANTKIVNSNCTLPLGNNPTIATANTLTGITLNGTLTGTGTLTTGTLTLNAGSSISGFSSLPIGGILTVAGATANFGGYSNVSVASSVTLSSGTLTLPNGADLNSSLTISGGTFNAPSGTMTVAGSLTISGAAIFNHNNGNLALDGGTATLSCNNVSFNLVTFTFTTPSTKTVNSNCTLPLGNNPTIATANTNTGILLNGTLTGTGTLTTPTTTLNTGSVLSGFSAYANGGAFTNAGATTDFSTYTSTSFSNTFALTSGTLTLSNTTNTITGVANQTGGTLNAGSGIVNMSNTFTLNNAGAIFNGNSAAITIASGLALTTGTFNSTSGDLKLLSNLTITGATFNHNNGILVLAGNNNRTLACNSAMFNLVKFQPTAGTYTVNTGCNFFLGDNPAQFTQSMSLGGTLSGTGIFNYSGFITLTMTAGSSLSGFSEYLGSVNVAGGTLDLTDYTNVQITAFTLSSGTFTGPATTGMTISSTYNQTGGTFNQPTGGTTTVASTFTVNGAGAIFNGSDQDIDLNAGLALTSGTFTAPSANIFINGGMSINGGIFSHNNGTIVFDGVTSGTLNCASNNFNLIALTSGGRRTINSNCVLPLGDNPTVGVPVTLNGTLTGSGTLTNNISMNFNSTNPLVGFDGFIVTGEMGLTGGILDFSGYSPVSLGHRYTQSGGTFTAPEGIMTVGDNFNHQSGIFNHNSGTVSLTGSFDGGQFILGGTTFYNLTKEVTNAQTIFIAAGETQTVLGNLTLKGTSVNPLVIRSNILNNQWNIDPQGNRDIEYVDVQDGNNINATTIQAPTGINSGNNTNWNFNNPLASNLGPGVVVDGGVITEKQPSFTFSISDADVVDDVRFRIQIDNNSDLSSPEVNYLSAYTDQGDFSFTVGQAAGTGSYSDGAPDQELADGTYYWRVSAQDNSGSPAVYTAANNSDIAFKIDTTGPTGSIDIVDDPGSTNPLRVKLNISASDNVSGVSQMIVSTDSNFTNSSFETYNTTKYITFSSSGTKIVYIKFKDAAGNESTTYTDSITILLPGVTPYPTPEPEPVPEPVPEPTPGEEPGETPGEEPTIPLYNISLTVVGLDDQPLIGVKVTLFGKELTTDSNGNVQFESIEPGLQSLVLGYNDKIGKYDVSIAGEDKEIKIKVVLEERVYVVPWLFVLCLVAIIAILILIIVYLKRKWLKKYFSKTHHYSLKKLLKRIKHRSRRHGQK